MLVNDSDDWDTHWRWSARSALGLTGDYKASGGDLSAPWGAQSAMSVENMMRNPE